MMLKRADTIARERARLGESIQRLFSFRQFTRMRSLQKQLYKLEQITLPGEAEKTRMRFKPSRDSGREVLTVEKLRKRFNEKPLLESVTFTLWRKDRAALLGPNGCGKTTLLRVLVDELAADGGMAHFGHQVHWYYYDQEGSNLEPTLSVIQEVARINPHLSPSMIRGALARFLIFGEDAERPVSTLSGGERSRVSLTKMFLSGANLLILDEPTNHLDIDGKEALEEALADYTGTVLMVSHDRYFIDRVANRVLEAHEGRIRDYQGNYTEFLAKRAALDTAQCEAKPIVKAATTPKVIVATAPRKGRSLQFCLRQQEQNEAQIATLEGRKATLETRLADSSLYADALRAKRITEEHQQVLRELQVAYAEWETTAEEIIGLEQELKEKRGKRKE